MIHFKSITIIVLIVSCTKITPNTCAETNTVSETIRLSTTNCTIDDLHNDENRFGDSDNVHIKIIIENCSIPSISSVAFAQLNNIISIDIIGSYVNSIDVNAFDGLFSLVRLSLTNNNLTTFYAWSEQSLNAVNTLDLHQNEIRQLDMNALRPYRNLEYLSLANNLITEIPNGFFGKNSKIRTLHLDGNSIERIEADTFKPLLQLEHLHLENNEISFIDEYAFATLVHLKMLRLDDNQITSLTSTLFFASSRLQQLNLSRNLLQTLAIQFEDNVELKVIDLSYNLLTSLQSNSIEGVQTMEVFNISHNRLQTIESSAFEDFVRIKQLDISNNELTSLRDNQLAFLESIEYLNLSHNSIDSIQPFTFTDLMTLRSIDLSHNRLDSDAFVQKITELKQLYLDLSANHYRSINITAFLGIGEVKLIGNLWSCSWLVIELVNLTASVRDEIHFGNKLGGIDAEGMGIRQPEEVLCFDDRNAAHDWNHLIQRHIVIIYPKIECNLNEEQKAITDDGHSQPFIELLSTEFDFKACLIWTMIAVIVVIGVLRLIKCCLDRSEKRSERYRITQQQRVMKDIDDYFSRTNTENK